MDDVETAIRRRLAQVPNTEVARGAFLPDRLEVRRKLATGTRYIEIAEVALERL